MSTLTGDIGKVKVGYQCAATLANWVVTRQQDTLGAPTVTLTSMVATTNGYWSRQRPLVVGLWMGGSWWVWTRMETDEALVTGTVVTALLIGDPIASISF